MARNSRFRPERDLQGAGAEPSVDRLPIYLRGYAAIPPRPTQRSRGDALSPSDWTLIFDTETRTDATQRLRIGAYQLLIGGSLERRGLFYDPEVIREDQLETLWAENARLRLSPLMKLGEFV